MSLATLSLRYFHQISLCIQDATIFPFSFKQNSRHGFYLHNAKWSEGFQKQHKSKASQGEKHIRIKRGWLHFVVMCSCAMLSHFVTFIRSVSVFRLRESLQSSTLDSNCFFSSWFLQFFFKLCRCFCIKIKIEKMFFAVFVWENDSWNWSGITVYIHSSYLVRIPIARDGSQERKPPRPVKPCISTILPGGFRVGGSFPLEWTPRGISFRDKSNGFPSVMRLECAGMRIHSDTC